MSDIPSPITRKDQYLSYLTGNTDYYPIDPITREEKYLFYLCENGGIGGGSVTPEQIQQAVDAYLEENPVKPGATVEQVAQIEKNKTDISELSEDLINGSVFLEKWNKIATTKFIYGQYINSLDGSIQNNELYAYSDYIRIEPFSEYEIKGFKTNQLFIAFYDSDNRFIKSEILNPLSSFVIVHAGEYYSIRISLPIEDIKNTSIEYKKPNYKEDFIRAAIDEEVTQNHIPIVEGYRLNWDNGELVGDSSCGYSDYIEICPNALLTLGGFPQDDVFVPICFYDSNKSFISGGWSEDSYKVPQNTKYVRYSFKLEYKNNFYASFKKESSSKKRTLIVGSEENCDYKTINEALQYAYIIESKDNPVTIIVEPGVYEEVLFISGNHYISIIGTNPKDCILIDETALYNNSPLRISGSCYIANMSFISTANKYSSSTGVGKEAWITDVKNGVKNPEWLSTIGAYAVHCDDEPIDDGSLKKSIFRNCYMYSESFPAFGSGMQKNQRIELLNCILETNIPVEVHEANKNNSQGTLTCHGKFGLSANTNDINQGIMVKDCIMKTNVGKVLNMYPEHMDDTASIIFINNTFLSDEDGDQKSYYNFTFSDSQISKASHGNNLDFLNKTL